MENKLILRVCPDEARQLILDWLIPLTENGTMDELMRAFVTELEPYATEAAHRVLRTRLLPGAPDLFLPRLNGFLKSLVVLLETMSLNPDMMAVAADHQTELLNAQTGLRDWIVLLDAAQARAQGGNR